MTEEEKKSVEVQIRFRIPQKMPTLLATEMIVQPSADGVLLSFFDVIPPIVPPTITQEQLESIQQAGITAECVSKIFVPKSKYPDFVKALQSILPTKEVVVSAEG